jgi:hypothetical protein
MRADDFCVADFRRRLHRRQMLSHQAGFARLLRIFSIRNGLQVTIDNLYPILDESHFSQLEHDEAWEYAEGTYFVMSVMMFIAAARLQLVWDESASASPGIDERFNAVSSNRRPL